MLAATATVIVATGQSPANIIILSLTVVSVSFVGMGAYRMLSPLVTNQPDAPVTIGGRTRVALEREKTLVLRSIKELEFDFAMGKIAKPDFDEMSARLRSRGDSALRLGGRCAPAPLGRLCDAVPRHASWHLRGGGAGSGDDGACPIASIQP